MTSVPETEIVVLLVTAPDAAVAERLGRTLVEERLAACANLLPSVTSIYRWKGEVQTDTEVLLLLKTQRARLSRLAERLAEVHPYEVPELLALPVRGGSERYCKWVVEETSERMP
jgi:periplasmic divalent cation tolerance protein